MIIRLDQKRMILQYIHQKFSGSINHELYTFGCQTCHNVTIDHLRHTSRNASCQLSYRRSLDWKS